MLINCLRSNRENCSGSHRGLVSLSPYVSVVQTNDRHETAVKGNVVAGWNLDGVVILLERR
jgi:hypothetical protein